MNRIVFFLAFTFLNLSLSGQEEPKKERREFKNTIKWNPTPLAFGSENLVFGYERVLPKNRTASINLGLIKFPVLADNPSGVLKNIERTRATGFTVSADYRFYPSKRNRLPAPDGVYFGPFVNYFRYNTDFSLDVYEAGVLEANGGLNSQIDIVFIGFQLGYQFVFWDRFTLDMILFGPALGMYGADFKAEGDISADQDMQEFFDYLKEQFPLIGDLATSGDAKATGASTSWSVGYRYSISIGYRF